MILAMSNKHKKPIIFISHISEEKEMAILLKKLIEKSYWEIFDVFVSSDGKSINPGDKYLDTITDNLKECVVELIICSPKSVTKPWINFEAGAGWIRNIPTIPLCYAGMEAKNLPIPISVLQAIKMSDALSLKSIFRTLSKAIGTDNIPDVDLTDFINEVKNFESKYVSGNGCSSVLNINYKGLKIYRTGDLVAFDRDENLLYEWIDDKYILTKFNKGKEYKHFVLCDYGEKDKIISIINSTGQYLVTGTGSSEKNSSKLRVWFIIKDKPTSGYGEYMNNIED